MINYLIYKLGVLLALHLPLKLAYKVAIVVADLQFFLSKEDRSAVMDNLFAILGKRDKYVYCTARQVFRNFAKYLVDFFRFSRIDNSYIKRYIKIKNIEHVDNALKEKKGIIFVSAHLGNWELGGVVIARLGYPISVVALDHKNKLINNFFIGQRAIMGVKVISIGIALRRCFSVLKKNELIGLLGDRDFSTHGIRMKFLGKDTLIPKGPATFALRTGAPLVPLFLLRNPDDTFTFVFEEAIRPQQTGDFDEDVKAVTAKIINVLERYIKAHPEQWYMFRRFWV